MVKFARLTLTRIRVILCKEIERKITRNVRNRAKMVEKYDKCFVNRAKTKRKSSTLWYNIENRSKSSEDGRKLRHTFRRSSRITDLHCMVTRWIFSNWNHKAAQAHEVTCLVFEDQKQIRTSGHELLIHTRSVHVINWYSHSVNTFIKFGYEEYRGSRGGSAYERGGLNRGLTVFRRLFSTIFCSLSLDTFWTVKMWQTRSSWFSLYCTHIPSMDHLRLVNKFSYHLMF